MYIIYGAGEKGRRTLIKCRDVGITNVIFTDSNPNLWGMEIDGIKVINPQNIIYDEVDLIIISMGYRDYCDVSNYLKSKCSDEKISFYNEAIFMSENDCINLGSIKFFQNKMKAGIYSKNQIISVLDPDTFNDIDKFIYQSNHRQIHKFIHYSEAYDRFFSKYRNKNIILLEIGVYKGGSLQLWKRYFGKNAKIIGIDIDETCKRLEDDGISIYIGNQEDRDFLNIVKKEVGKVDIIIDDGGHFMNQQIVSFEELFELLDENGVYLCEDCQTSYMPEYNGGIKTTNTFIEFTKKKIDDMHANYIGQPYVKAKYADEIKSITYYENMVFIEKRNKSNLNIDVKI